MAFGEPQPRVAAASGADLAFIQRLWKVCGCSFYAVSWGHSLGSRVSRVEATAVIQWRQVEAAVRAVEVGGLDGNARWACSQWSGAALKQRLMPGFSLVITLERVALTGMGCSRMKWCRRRG